MWCVDASWGGGVSCTMYIIMSDLVFRIKSCPQHISYII